MGPFKKKKHEKQRLLSDDYDDDDQQFSTADDFDIQPSKAAEDGFDIQPSNEDGGFEMQFASTGGDAFDDSGGLSPFDSLDPFTRSAESGFPSSADPDFSSGGDPVDPQPSETKEDEPEEVDPESFQPKDLGTFEADEPFELVIKDLDKERELLEKGEDPTGAILVDFPSARQEKEQKAEPELEPEAAPAKKGRRMRRFSLGAKPSEDIMDKNGDNDPQAFEQELGEFQASFSALALEIGDAQDFDTDGKKKKKGVKMFRKGKESETKKPAGHSAEIVVDKSKIPTQKVAPGIKDGELFVGFPSSNHDVEEPAAEKGKKSGRLKSLAKGLKKKVGQSTRHLTQQVEHSDSGHGDSGYGDSGHGNSGHGDSGHESDVISDSDEEGILGKHSEGSKYNNAGHEEAEAIEKRPVRARRRLSVSGTAPSHDGAAQRTRRRESRIDNHGAARRVRSDGVAKEESERNRPDRARRIKSDGVAKDESERIRPDRAHRNSSGDRPRRHTMLEKHQAGAHGQRLSQRSKHSDQDDSNVVSTADSSHQGEESVTSAESGKHDEGHKTGPSRTGDAAKPGGRRAQMAKAKSRRAIDPLSTSSHKPPGRRVPASDALKRRAMSTRQLGVAPPPNDTLTHSSHSNPKTNSPQRTNSGGDHRRRMTRKPMSERHLGANGKSGKPVLKTKTSGNDTSDDGGLVHGWSRNIINAGSQTRSSHHSRGSSKEIVRAEADDTENTEGDDGASYPSESANVAPSDSDVVSKALASDNLTKEEVEKLVRVVALQAKDAKSTEDLESIVMGALLGGDRATDGSEKQSPEGHTESSASFSIDESDDEEHKLNPEVIQSETRHHVQAFLKQRNHDELLSENVGISESESSGHNRSLKNNYAQVFLSIDASSREGGSLRDESKRGSLRDESKRGSMKDESNEGSMREGSKQGGSMRERSKRTMVDDSRRSMKEGSKRSSKTDVSNVLLKLEEAKARTQEMAKSRAKTQVAK